MIIIINDESVPAPLNYKNPADQATPGPVRPCGNTHLFPIRQLEKPNIARFEVPTSGPIV